MQFFSGSKSFSIQSDVKNLLMEHRKISKLSRLSTQSKEAIKKRRELAKFDLESTIFNFEDGNFLYRMMYTLNVFD